MFPNKQQLILKPGREKSLQRRHPWIFSGAVGEVGGDPEPGSTIEILSSSGEFLANAAFSPQSQIRARVWNWQHEEAVDEVFFRERLRRAINLRHGLDAQSDAYRLVHAESDGLPGIVVDKYGDSLVVQLLSWGAEFWKETIFNELEALIEPGAILERSDVEVRKLEGLSERTGFVRGKMYSNDIRISEFGLDFKVDVTTGHKTGFYLDQRENRLIARDLVSGREVLDCFSYTGGFSLNALRGGAKSVTLIEESSAALGLARINFELNKLDAVSNEFIQGDAFQVLRKFRDEARQFDMVILDPPKFAPTRAQTDRAARGYKDINLLAFKLLRPGGILLTFSCSGGIDAGFFQKIVAGAALDAGVDAKILRRLSQGSDHPVALNFPEGEYLKGLIVQV